MKLIKLFIKVLIIFVIVVFGAFNMQMVEVKYFFNRTISLPLFIVMLIVFFFGMLLAYFIFIFDRIKLKSELSKTKQTKKETDEELLRLRNLPLFEEEKEKNEESQN